MSISNILQDIGNAARTLFGDKFTGPRSRTDQFRDLVNAHGVAYENVFAVTIYHRSAFSDVQELVSFFCMAAQIPALNLLTSTYRENAAHYELPYGISYEPLNLLMMGDKSLVIKQFFDLWYRSVYDVASNRLEFPNTYRFDIKIQILDRSKTQLGSTDEVYSVMLKGAYPKSVGNVNLSHRGQDIVTFPVQVVYEKLELLQSDQSDLALFLQDNTFAAIPIQSNQNFPFNVIENVKGVASELMAGVMKDVESFGGAVADIGRGIATISNVTADALRDKVSVPIYDRNIVNKE